MARQSAAAAVRADAPSRPPVSRLRTQLLAMSQGRGAATRVWALLFDLLASTKERWPAVAAELGFRPTQLRMMLMLFSGERLVQRDLAQMLECDASNVTALVDHLEEKGLVERRSSLGDRRAKQLVLTRAGEALMPKVLERVLEPPPALGALSAAELKTLIGLLEKVHARATGA